MARLLKIVVVFLLWTGLSDRITRVGGAEVHLKFINDFLLEQRGIPNNEERLVGKIEELQMAIDYPNKIFMATESLFASASIEGNKGVITPESRFSPEHIFSAKSKFSGFIQHEAKYILFVRPRAGCIVRSSMDNWKINEVIAGKCGVNDHADGYLKSARLQRPTRIVKNPTSYLSYFVLDKSRIKNMDLISKNISTIQDFNQTTIIDVAVNGRGEVFAVAEGDKAAYLLTFSLFEPDSTPQTITSSSMIHSKFLFSSPLFGTSISSLAFVGDDMLVFTDPSNRALKVVRTMNSNTSGLLTICQPFGKPTIEFIDSVMSGHHCNKSFSPSLVRSQGDNILVLSENKVIIFNISESNDDTTTIDLKTLAVYISYSSLVGVLSIIVIYLSVKNHKIKMRYGQEKRRHAPDISYPLQGSIGPESVMTDDSSAERGALRDVFPSARLLLCTFHLLQAVNRWCGRLGSEDSETCYPWVYKMLYSQTVEECQALLKEGLDCETFSQYFETYYRPRIEDWALCYRANLQNDGINTNNHVERQFRTVKEGLLDRKTSYNTAELAERICSGYEDLVSERLLEYAHQRKPLLGQVDKSMAMTIREQLYWIATGSSPPTDWCGPLANVPSKAGEPSEPKSPLKRRLREKTNSGWRRRHIQVNQNRKRLRRRV